MKSTKTRSIAIGLLRRLLDGERGDLPMHLGHLLDRASCMRDSDSFYRWVLPPELANIRLSPETRLEVIAALCLEVTRNPDEALLTVLSYSEDDLSVRTVASVLVKSPRCLTMRELGVGLGFLKASLPACLQHNSDFIPEHEVERLVQLAKEFQNIVIEEGDTDQERSIRNHVKLSAEYLIEGLAQVGFSTG
jgi:hypothetical protein